MNDYYSSLIDELMAGGMGDARYASKRLSPIMSNLPGHMSAGDVAGQATGGGMNRRDAQMAASRAEDTWLGAALGSERDRRKGEKSGSYAQAWYPGIDHTADMMGAGVGSPLHAQMMIRMSPEERMAFEERLRQWGAQQQALLQGVPGFGRRG